MPSHPITLQHHEALRTHGNQHAQLPDGALRRYPIDGDVTQPPVLVAQGVLNRYPVLDAHDFITHGLKRTGYRRLA